MGEVLHFPNRGLLKLIEAVNGVLRGDCEPTKALALAEEVMRDCGAIQSPDGQWHLPEESPDNG